MRKSTQRHTHNYVVMMELKELYIPLPFKMRVFKMQVSVRTKNNLEIKLVSFLVKHYLK